MRRLLFLCAALAWAQQDVIPTPVFPDQTQDPKLAGGAEMLEAVCPGHVIVGEQIACGGPCSAYFKGLDWVGGWSLERVIRGHFLSPESDDVALDMLGCEPHSENFGGTILLTHRSGKWTELWYKAGVSTSNCHKVILPSRRELLVCLGSDGGQGFVSSELYTEDLLAPAPALMAGNESTIFQILDTTATCGFNSEDELRPIPLEHAYIERVEFHASAKGFTQGLTVYGRRGRQTMTLDQVKTCTDQMAGKVRGKGINFIPATKPFRTDFIFDGTTFKRTGKN